MEHRRFDSLARLAAGRTGRRPVLLAVAGLAIGLSRPDSPVAAKGKKGKGGFGCTTQDDSCTTGKVGCPDAPGGICVQRQGKPVCAALTVCAACAKDRDCVPKFGKGSRCIKDCPSCQATARPPTMCILPQSKAKG